VATAALLAVAFSTGAASSARADLHGRVAGVRAGDILDVSLNGRAQQIRLIGVRPQAHSACYGARALAWMRARAEGHTVALILDRGSGVRDSSGRLRAYAQVRGVGDLGEALIRAGLARVGQAAFVRRSRYLAAEQDALVHALGIWSACPVELPGAKPQPKLPVDVSVALVAQPQRVTAGNVATFAATVGNTGAGFAEGVSLHFRVPAGAVVVSAGYPLPPGVPPGETSCSTVPPVTCLIGRLGPGEGQSVLEIRLQTTAPGDLTIGAEVDTTSRDTTTGNNIAAATASVAAGPPSADLSMAVGGPTRVAVGDRFSYEIRVHNAGPTEATDVELGGYIPSGASSSGGLQLLGRAGSLCFHDACRLGSIAAGETVTAQVAVLARVQGTLTERPRLTSSTPDPSPANDTAAASTSVGPPAATADLRVVLTALPATVRAGQAFSLVAEVRNSGPDPAESVHVVVQYSPARTVSATTDRGTCDQIPAGVGCALGALPAGSEARVDVVVRSGVLDWEFEAYASADSRTFDPSLAGAGEANDAEAVVSVAAPTSPSFEIAGDEWLGYLPIRHARVPTAANAFGLPTARHLTGRAGESCLVTWKRFGLQLRTLIDGPEFQGGADPCHDGTVNDALVTGARWHTAAGLRIGDPEARLDELYPGAPRRGAWRWLVTRKLARTGDAVYPTVLAKIADGRVAAFRVNRAGVSDIIFFPPSGD
jgi:uncharacterized repeat protein (TIGR01451 family)